MEAIFKVTKRWGFQTESRRQARSSKEIHELAGLSLSAAIRLLRELEDNGVDLSPDELVIAIHTIWDQLDFESPPSHLFARGYVFSTFELERILF